MSIRHARVGTTCLLASLFVGAVAFGQTPITKATISPSQLADVVDGAGNVLPVGVGDPQDPTGVPLSFFDDYSWRMFIALNWPALGGQRGKPDTSKSLHAAGPRVWETWKSAFETIPEKGKTPTAWSSFDAAVPIPGIPVADGGKQRVFGSFTKYGDISQADFLALAGPLVCQNDTFAH